jgi:hypothetical protein
MKHFHIIYCVGNSHKSIADFSVLLTAALQALPQIRGSYGRNNEGYVIPGK